MDLDVLKVYAASLISELDLNAKDKIELITFVKEADEYDIMSLITEGDIPDKWTEDYLVHLEGEMAFLDESIELVADTIISEGFKDWAKKTKDVSVAAGKGLKKGAVSGVKKGFAGQKAGAGMKAVGRKSRTSKSFQAGRAAGRAVGKAGKLVKDNPKKAIGAGLAVGALATAAALRARKKRKEAEQEEGK